MKEEFLKKLKQLLEEYNIMIGFKVGDCSDMYGLFDERIVIEDKNEQEILSVDGWWLSSLDIKDY